MPNRSSFIQVPITETESRGWDVPGVTPRIGTVKRTSQPPLGAENAIADEPVSFGMQERVSDFLSSFSKSSMVTLGVIFILEIFLLQCHTFLKCSPGLSPLKERRDDSKRDCAEPMRSHHLRILSNGFLIVVVLATAEGIHPNDSQWFQDGMPDSRMAAHFAFQGLPLPIDEESDRYDDFTRWNSLLRLSSDDPMCLCVELSPSLAGTPDPEHREFSRLTPRSPPLRMV